VTLSAGTKLGPYKILSPLGAGGMGEVYRATDRKLNRDVAIKVLPAEVAGDPERLARFKREAQVLASLNHPHIAAIHGLEEADGRPFLVLELVEGEDLTERLKRGPIPVDEALAIAKQIAEALEEAHEHGIVHRDLKPANVKLTPDGKVKVLDFGLAKAYADPSAGGLGPDLSQSPTLARTGTQAGVILGTAAYISPEQARGKPVDKRSDIWAFGVVLYEMLSGRRLFAGETVSDVLAAVLKTEIDLAGLPGATPPALRRLVGRCLDRQPKERLRDIGEARVALERLATGDAGVDHAPRPGPGRGSTRLPWAIAALSTLAALALWLAGGNAPAPASAPTVRFELAWPGATSSASADSAYFDLSPDGRWLVMVAQGQLFVRALDSVLERPLAGTEGASYPFWSPDSAWIGFFAGGELRRIARDGGSAQKLCDTPGGRGGAWSPEGTIVFSDRGGAFGLSRVGEQGGKPIPLPRVPSSGGTSNHRYPQFLPDGRHFIFTYLTGSPEAAGVYVGDLDGTPPVRVLDGTDHALFAPAPTPAEAGHLLFRRQEVLMARPFDAERLRVVGEMFPVAERVGQSGNTGHGAFAVSASGVLAYSELSRESEVLTWLDRSGRRSGTTTGRLALRGFALSPDERIAAYASSNVSFRGDVWLQPMGGGSPSRFTFGNSGPGWAFPLWSPDGRQLAYATRDNAGQDRYEIRRRRVDRTGPEETLLSVDAGIYRPWDWSPDGRHLVYSDDRSSDLWLLPLEGGAKPLAFTATPAQDCCAQFSPDGRFMAYASGAPGSSQVFVQPVPPTGALWQVSIAGGGMPRWRGDGRELFYRAEDGRLMAVAVRPSAGTFDSGTPQALFDGIPSSGSVSYFTYQPTRDGQRFLVSLRDAESRSPITVVLNWQGAIR